MMRFYRSLFTLLIVLLPGLAGPSLAYEIPVVGFVQNLDGIMSPERIATSEGGMIYVTDTYENEVIIVDPSGNKTGSIKETGVPRGVKVLPDGRILVGYTSEAGGYVSIYNSSGSFIRRLGSGIGEFSMPSSIAADPSTGVIYVADSVRNYVYRYDKDGNFLSRFGGYGFTPPQLDYPAAVAFDPSRNEVLVGDQGNFRIKVYDPAGNFLRMFGTNAPDSSWIFGTLSPEKLIGRFSKLQGLTVDSQSRLYVVDSFQCAVQMFDIASGNPLGVFGDYGDGSAKLMTPIDITVSSSGQFIITDWNNNRLSFWQIGLVTPPPAANTAPAVPALSFPVNGATVATLSPVLGVVNSTDVEGDALQYIFQVDTSASFNSANLRTATVSQGAAASSAGVTLPVDHMAYFWRVKAKETSTAGQLESGWSTVGNFVVHAENRAPSVPTGLTPATGTTITDADSLSWSASSDPDGDAITYTVEIASDAAFASIVEIRGGISAAGAAITQFSSLLNKPSATYYWRVKAVDGNGGVSPNSVAGSFVYGVSKATILVSSSPSGALVYLDGNYGYLAVYKGQTGTEPLSIQVEPGRHVVRVAKNGYNEFYGSYDVTQGQTVTVNAAMSTYASYSFTSNSSLTAGGSTLGNSNPDFSYAAPFAVDWDNDGKKDLLVGASNGNVYYYSNSGSNASPSLSFVGSIVNTGSGAYPFVADWNNDGKKDLLVGTISGTVLLYINYGADSAPSFSGGVPVQAGGVVISAGSYAAPAVVDWNNDGNKDLLVGNSSGYVRLYLNAGSDDNPLLVDNGYLKMGTSTLRAGSYATPVVIDWDRDGRKDLIVGAGGSSAGVYWFRNGGTDAAPIFSSYSRLSDSTSSLSSRSYAVPFVLDWNNTAPFDLLVGGQDGTVRLYRK